MEMSIKRKYDDVTPEGLYNIIQYLKNSFAPELSKKVIELFHERMRDEIDFDPVLLHSLMQHVFAQIIQGYSADQALGLTAIKGKYNRPDNTERDLTASSIVILQMRKGISWEDAVTDAAEHLSVSNRTVERAYKSCREGIEMFPDAPLMTLAGEFFPPP